MRRHPDTPPPLLACLSNHPLRKSPLPNSSSLTTRLPSLTRCRSNANSVGTCETPYRTTESPSCELSICTSAKPRPVLFLSPILSSQRRECKSGLREALVGQKDVVQRVMRGWFEAAVRRRRVSRSCGVRMESKIRLVGVAGEGLKREKGRVGGSRVSEVFVAGSL